MRILFALVSNKIESYFGITLYPTFIFNLLDLITNPMPSLEHGSYINIPPTNNQDIHDPMPNDISPPVAENGRANEINPITNDNDIEQLNNNPSTSEPPSRTNSNTMKNANPLVNPLESPLASPPPIISNQSPQTPTGNSPTTISGAIDTENNNIFNGFLPTMLAQNNDNFKEEKPKTTSDFRTNRPPPIDLFMNQHNPLRYVYQIVIFLYQLYSRLSTIVLMI